MTAYAVAHLRNVAIGPEIIDYIEMIDATLAPYHGKFLVHGARPTVLEGSWPGDLVVIAFPSRQQAMAWYGSADYQAILPLRLNNSDGDVILIDGVSEDHKSTDILDAMVSH